MRKKKEIRIIAIMCCMILSIIAMKPCLAADAGEKAGEKTTVKVAYFDLGDYYKVDEDGQLDSFDAAYLNMVTQYTDYEFEYVDCGTWERALQMLNNHEVDLVGTMQWTMEREEKYSICDQSYGYAVSEMATLPDSDLVYEDYSQLEGRTIGCIENYVIADYLKELMEEEGFQATIQTYPTQKALDAALENREIDVVAASAYAMHDEWKIISRFSYGALYFASWNGNDELTQEISDALIQINIYQEGFGDGLIQKYFADMVNAPYNKDELNCIAQGKTYTIYFDEDTRPMSWYDEDTDSMKGILVDICRLLEARTGLKIEIKPRSQMKSGEADNTVSYYTFSSAYDAVYNGEDGKTESIYEDEFLLFHISGEEYDSSPQNHYKVALPKGREGYIKYLNKTYPGYEVMEYDTPGACAEALLSGAVDLMFLSGGVADNILISQDISEIVSMPTTSVPLEVGLQFSGEDAEILANVVNKGFQLIGTNEINDIKLAQLSAITPEPTLSYVIKNHPYEAVAVAASFVLLLAVIVSLFFYAKVIEKKNQQIIASNQARMEFFSRMSHDMRTPMNGILGMARLSNEEDDVKVLRHNMEMVEESGVYMLSLINDTLDLQKIETGKMKLNPEIVSASRFFEGVFDMVRATARQKNITFKINTTNVNKDSYIKVDPVRLKQIFSNLLSNAIKFTPEGGCVEFSGEQRANRLYVFQVKDTGVGISREFIENGLFTAYSQERNSVGNEKAGSGLGLAITKNLVEMMGGQINVESELGEGSTFTVYLRIEEVDKELALQSTSEKTSTEKRLERQLNGKHLLICEDHPLNAEIARRLLEKAGCKVSWAKDGEEGVKIFAQSERGEYDAILMDIRMPKMNGLDSTRAIRALERQDAKEIPIIAMTANAYDEDIRQSLEAGMNEHLAKPIEPGKLYETLVRHIGG